MIRFRFVDDHRDVYDVKRMCALVEASRSSFYAWAAGPSEAAKAREAADIELAVVIDRSGGTRAAPTAGPGCGVS